MKSTALLLAVLLAGFLFSCPQAYSAVSGAVSRGDAVEENIWALEEAYFTNLYKADYEAVLDIVHSRFLGWPGNVPQPVDKEGSARFMKQLISGPSSCTFKIERKGIRVQGDVALTQYIINVDCGDAAGAKTQSSRITHTWVKTGGRWKLLGGMSCDQ